jgi:hypothetical protein
LSRPAETRTYSVLQDSTSVVATQVCARERQTAPPVRLTEFAMRDARAEPVPAPPNIPRRNSRPQAVSLSGVGLIGARFRASRRRPQRGTFGSSSRGSAQCSYCFRDLNSGKGAEPEVAELRRPTTTPRGETPLRLLTLRSNSDGSAPRALTLGRRAISRRPNGL